MSRFIRARFTYANLMATVAVFIALGGVGYAATQLPKNSVGAKQLKKNAVTSVKVKDGSLRAKDFKSGQLPAGPAGPQGPTGPQGPAGDTAPLPHARIRLAGHSQTLLTHPSFVSFDKVVEDTGGMADIANHPTSLVAPRDGLYQVSAVLSWQNLNGEGRAGGAIVALRADGSESLADKSQSVYGFVKTLQFVNQPLSEVVRLSAGQQVALSAFQDAAATNTLSFSDEGTFLEMTWLGN